jgi:CRP-like cAMP-binding protein
MLAEAGEALTCNIVLEHHQPGRLLWAQGDAITHVFVNSGPVRIGTLDNKGNIHAPFLVRDSHLIGEAEVFAGLAVRFNEACALVTQDVLRIPASDFQQCIEISPKLALAWLKMSNQRFLLVARHAEVLVQHSAEERLRSALKVLLLLTPANADGTVSLPFSQEALGCMAGLTRQAASKVVADWRKRSLVQTGYQSLVVLHPGHFQSRSADK